MQLSARTTHAVVATLAALAGTLVETPAHAGPVLYASDTHTNSLYSLDQTDASAALVGSFGVTDIMSGLGYDAQRDILFSTSTIRNDLYSIDRSTGFATWIGNLGVELMHALEYDASTDTLFGAFGTPLGDELYSIDPSTATATPIGHIGFFDDDQQNTVHGLAVHPETGVLYGAVVRPVIPGGALIEIDKITGQGTLIGEFAQHIAGLAFNPDTNVLFALDNLEDALYTIDITTAETESVGLTGLGKAPGLAFTPEPASLSLLVLGGLLAFARRRP